MMARTISITMQNFVEIARRMSAWEDEMWCFHFLPAWSARRAALPVFRLLTGRFSPRRGDTLHRSRWNLAWRSRPPCQIWPWSVQGWGFTVPKTEKNSNFTNIIAPKGGSLSRFTKFTGCMRVHSVYHVAEFGCFISINDKIINNLLRWGVFSQIFDAP